MIKITKSDLINKKQYIKDFFEKSMNNASWGGLNKTLKDIENIFNSDISITHITIEVQKNVYSLNEPNGIFVLKDQNGKEVGRILKPL